MKSKRMMVIDDQAGIRFLVKEIFKDQGYEVCEACNAEEALDKFEAAAPDVVIVDLGLGGKSGMDGGDVIKSMKSIKQEVVPIIITGYSDSEKVQKALKNGAVSYVQKPFDVDELIDIVRAKYENL